MVIMNMVNWVKLQQAKPQTKLTHHQGTGAEGILAKNMGSQRYPKGANTTLKIW